MRILYVIQSCDNYVETRCKTSVETWVTKINHKSDYIILTSNSNKEKTFSTKTRDDYWSLPDKWTVFLRRYDFSNYDWIFCIDDDNFVFPERLENYINQNNFNPNEPVVIGSRHCDFREMGDVIFCGGGGILMSKKSIEILIEHIISDSFETRYLCHDCFMFFIFKKNNLTIINSNQNGEMEGPFYSGKPPEMTHHKHLYDSCITMHYCDNEFKHLLYNKYYQ